MPVNPQLSVPSRVARFWQPCDPNWVSPENPCGFHPPILEKGWERVLSEGVWGEPPLTATLDRDLWISRPYGSWGVDPAAWPVIGTYPITGQPTGCEPRAFTELAAAEAQLPGFLPALAPLIARIHARGGRVYLYAGTPAASLFEPGTAPEKQAEILDAAILPLKHAGLGPRDIVFCDACAATSQEAKTAGMMFAERVLLHGIGFGVEANERIHPKLFPWFNNRFSACAAKCSDRSRSRWDAACTESNWFGPGTPLAVREHFVTIQGGAEGRGTTADRAAMVPPPVVQGVPVITAMELSDFPPSMILSSPA